MTTLFISDLHLEEGRPAITALFLAFLRTRARQAEALYILGDLFEFWVGDDMVTELSRDVAAGITAVRQSGVPCYFMHGNRDFMVGESWTERAGLKLLPEETVIDLYGQPTLLLHGDTLCTDDTAYQVVRAKVRDPDWQSRLLAMSIEDRLEYAQNARDASKQHTSTVCTAIMDVNQQAVTDAFRRHDVMRMIHGHTHRPAFHEHDMGGHTARRIVLADWYQHGSVLEVSREGEVLHPLDGIV
jgi:UDP-2,3-diacylglucosamine hydrolase